MDEFLSDKEERRAEKFERDVQYVRGRAALFADVEKLDRDVYQWNPAQKARLAALLGTIRDRLDEAIRYLESKPQSGRQRPRRGS